MLWRMGTWAITRGIELGIRREVVVGMVAVVIIPVRTRRNSVEMIGNGSLEPFGSGHLACLTGRKAIYRLTGPKLG